MKSRRTIRLTERVAGDCRLTARDVEFLLAEHRRRLELLPVGRRGHYRVLSRGWVGTLVAPTCRLVIRPKVPLRNFYHLLDPDAPLLTAEDRAAPDWPAEVIDFLALRLGSLIARCTAGGLHRAYAERTGSQSFLQGQLDVAAQVRAARSSPDQLHCRFEEFTTDVPCNQAIKATAVRLLQCPLLGPDVRARLTASLGAFAEVRPVTPSPAQLVTALNDPLTRHYGPLLRLCRLLADSLAPGSGAGAIDCPAFLVNMERVFEHYGTTRIRDGLRDSGLAVLAQHMHTIAAREPGQPSIEMRPDLTVEWDGRPVLAVDFKWKRRPRTGVITPDLYQVMGYCLGLGVRRAILVYPGGRHDEVGTYQLGDSLTRLTLSSIAVAGARATLERSVRAVLGLVRAEARG